VERVRADLPDAAIAFVSIKPSVARFAKWPRMLAANEGIARWARLQRNVRFVDVTAAMLDLHRKPRPELFLADGLHMRQAGHALWSAAPKRVLAAHGFAVRSAGGPVTP